MARDIYNWSNELKLSHKPLFPLFGSSNNNLYKIRKHNIADIKRSWVRTSLSALHFAGVRLGSYNPSPDPTLCGSFYALGLSFYNIADICISSNNKPWLFSVSEAS